MTNEQAKKMLKAKLECLKRETSGTDFDCNNRNCDECSLCYEQGNMEEQKEALDMAIKALEQQPCEDTISRQAAVEALKNRWKKTRNYEGIGDDIAEECELYLKQLPSAQPEPLTDKEQRIFLAAMGREEKVCKQVDEECRDCREAYEDSLVKTCHEIIRKVKGALWT